MTDTISRLTLVLPLLVSFSSVAATFTLEPDNYANGADLTHALPQVTLQLATSSDNQSVVPSWYISAVTDSYASTGSNVFGYLGAFPSLWDGRRLRMDFTSPVSEVSIDFISTSNDAGELDIFDSNWQSLGSFTTPALAAHQVETMTFTSGTLNIAHAVAYSQGTGFGRLDELQFSTVVPEPSSLLLGPLFGAALVLLRKTRAN